MSSSKDTINKPINGNSSHHTCELGIHAQPHKMPAISPIPPMRGVGVACKERSLGMSGNLAAEPAIQDHSSQ